MNLMLHLILLFATSLDSAQLGNVRYSSIWHSPEAKFQETLDYLTNVTKMDENPCANFYGYSCGNYAKHFKGEYPAFEMTQKNVQLLLPILNKSEPKELKSIQLVKKFFAKCVKAGGQVLPSDIHALLPIFKEFESVTGIPFPAIANNDIQLSVNSTQITKAVAFVEKLPSDLLFVQANILESAQKDKEAYILPIMLRPGYCSNNADGVEQMQTFFDAYQKQLGNISAGLVETTLQDLTQFIQTIKNELCDESETDDTQHVMENIRLLKPFTASEFNTLFHSFDAKTFLQEFTKTSSQEVKSKLLSENFTVYANIDKFRKLDSLILGPTPKISGRQLANHFYMNLILYLWEPKESNNELHFNDAVANRNFYSREQDLLAFSASELNPVEIKCLGHFEVWNPKNYMMIGSIFRLAYGRLYVDALSKKEDLVETRAKISKLVQYIIRGFRSMINQVDWLTPKSTEKALKKLDNMALNILYNNISMNDAKLEEYYGSLSFADNWTMSEVMNSLRQFHLEKELQKLVTNVVDRDDMTYPADTINAAYNPLQNSINIFLGILQQPTFDVNWPMEWNFGSIGAIIGHEISHGFDNQGVLFDELGYYAPWMEPPTEEAFNKMEKCITEQYSKYYICDNTTDPLNGTRTLGENIADNAGIHAAFRGYQHWKDTVGEEPGLPPIKGPLGQLKDDQLFFLATSQFWCQKVCRYYPLDVHSPFKVRVHGMLSNFPAFHNAFDCKIGDEYRPKDKCDVWITEVMHKRFISNHHI